ncbi:putative lipocalin [Powai lake megavirus]|uniref:Putative lipocalin n=1 Tax=Powai lake megavirus TaxID=1842663 RepID=A0A167RLA9_9VIRU|nr:putative lipocalin [Powai lake megavirus]ANB50822.1 putative lipocalin [Powai lake megavirus]
MSRNYQIDAVPNLDIVKYMGTWYEIARFPTSFQQNCINSTAIYSLLYLEPVPTISVDNRCQIGENIIQARGLAIPSSNSKLIPGTNILIPGSLSLKIGNNISSYNVIYIDKNYQYSIVSSDRNNLWILSRYPNIDNVTYNYLISIAKEKGYDISKLVRNNIQ